jgi:serine/threonine-protein kinase
MEGLRTDLPILESIGSYRLLKHLGADGSVQVYLARKEGSDRSSAEVVLKIVSALADEDPKKIEELRREASFFSKLNHPAVIRMHEFFEHGNSLVFVLENVEGMSLAELTTGATTKKRALPDDAVSYVGMSICEALAHAHGACSREGRTSTVLHKGMSPSKVRVTRDGTVKLGGFGLAKPFGVSVQRKGRPEWESTYLAPEQVLGQPLSPKVDVYATGLILWELLTGRSAAIVVPKDPLELPSAMRALTERTLDSLVWLRPDLPRALSAAIDAAVIASPEKRTIGCAELAQEFRKLGRANRGKEELRAKIRARLDPESAVSVAPPVPPPPPPPVPLPPALVPSKVPSTRETPSPRIVAAAERIQATPIMAIDAPPPASPTRRPPPPPPKFVPAPEAPPAPLPKDSVTSATMEVPASAALPHHEQAPTASAALEPAEKDRVAIPGVGSTAAMALASALRRVRLPSGWPRNARVATYVGVPLAMTLLIVTIAVARSRRSPDQPAVDATAALADTRPIAPAPPATPEPQPSPPAVEAPSMQKPAEKPTLPAREPKAPAAPAAKVAAQAPVPASTGGEFSAALKRRNLGHLVVHSSARYAQVFMGPYKIGRVDENMTVVCGKRFIAIGLPPRRGRREPVWLAPGTSTIIPCGGTVTLTLNPRRLR